MTAESPGEPWVGSRARGMRAALGMGLTWAAGVFGASFALWIVVGPDAADVFFPAGFAVLGFLGGVLFSVFLRLFEGRPGLGGMSLLRASAWGAASGLLFSGIFAGVAAWTGAVEPLEHLAGLAPLFAVCGAILATGSLTVVRAAADRKSVRAAACVLGLVREDGRE